MGFNISVALTMVVTGILISASTLVLGLDRFLDENQDGKNEYADIQQDKFSEHVDLIQCHVTDTEVSIGMRNMGDKVLKVDEVELLVNGVYQYPKDGRTNVDGDMQTNYWGPVEDLQFVVTRPPADIEDLELLVMTGEGVVDIDADLCKYVKMVSPDGGERWLIGSYKIIKWRAQGIPSVRLEYSLDNFTSDIRVITANTPNDGVYRWQVPNTPSHNARFRVMQADNHHVIDFGDANMSIVGPVPTAWWPLNETSGSTAADYYEGNDGTLYNMEEADWVNATVANGLELDGVDEYVSVTSSADLNATSGVTMAAWVKPTGAASAYWKFKKLITLDSSKVTGTLIDYPLIISIDDGDLKDVLSGGWVQPDGGDLVFTLTDGTPLDYEIEAYNGSSGKLVAWVKVPVVASGVNTELYLYYGNPFVDDHQDNSAVWDSGYKGVWHMDQNTTDSSDYGNDGFYMGTYIDKIDVQTTGTNNDAEECTSGTMRLSDKDLELGRDDVSCGGLQTVALRFQNLQIPQGATIASAHVRFEGDAADSEETDLTLYAQATDDATGFSSSAYDITNREWTQQSIEWADVETWAKGLNYLSPDISRLIQEVVNRPGWQVGNDMVIMINGTGQRVGLSYDVAGGANAPLLHVEYLNDVVYEALILANDDDAEECASGTVHLDSNDIELGRDDGTCGGLQTVGLRFDRLDLSRNTRITRAYLEFSNNATDTEDTDLTIYVEDSDNAAPFTTSDYNLTNRPVMDNSVTWDDVASWTVLEGKYQSPDLTAQVQEMVNRPGWNSDSAMVFLINGTGQRVFENKEADFWNASLLHLEIEPLGILDGAMYFDGIYDEMVVNDDASLDITDELTLEVFLESGKGTVGGIHNETKIDYFEYDTSNGEEPHIIKLSQNHFAIAYQGSGDDGWLKTVYIDDDGFILGTNDSFEFSPGEGREPEIMRVSGDIYAIAYQGPSGDGWVQTVEIEGDGNILGTVDSWEFDTSNAEDVDLLRIDGDIFAVAYEGPSDDGWLKTFLIEEDGTISSLSGTTSTPFQDDFNRGDSSTVGNGWEEVEGGSSQVSIDNYRLDFYGNNQGNLPQVSNTFAEQSHGTFTWSFTFNFERTGNENYYEVFMQLGDELLMVDPSVSDSTGVAVNLKWAGPNHGMTNHEGFGYVNGASVTEIGVVSGYDGYNTGGDATITVTVDMDAQDYDISITGAGLVSGGGSATSVAFDDDVNISCIRIYMDEVADGNFDDEEIDDILIQTGVINDELEFDTSSADEPAIRRVGDESYAIAYQGPSSDGWLKTVRINTNGSVNPTIVDSIEFETDYCDDPDLISISGELYATIYDGPGSDGWIVSLSIDDNGTIYNQVLDSYEFDDRNGEYPDIFHISGYVFGVVYDGPGTDGFLSILKIFDNGEIYMPPMVQVIWDDRTGTEPMIIKVTGDIYAIVYKGASGDGYIMTLHIGSISVGKIEAYGFSMDNEYVYSWINEEAITTEVADSWNHIVLTYDSDGGANNAKVYINGVLSVQETIPGGITSNEHPVIIGRFFHNLIDDVRIENRVRNLSWIATNNAIFQAPEEAITVSSQTAAGISKPGSYAMGTTRGQIFATLNNQTLYSSLTPDQWNHVLLTYDQNLSSDHFKLYIDGVQQASTNHTVTIDSNSATLLLGEMYGFVGQEDEIRYYDSGFNRTEMQDLYYNYNLTVDLLTPDGGEIWTAGRAEAITWYSEGDMEYVKLEYSKDNFTSDINVIINSTANNHYFSWTLPADYSTTMKVRISSVANSSIQDRSQANFTIREEMPELVLTQPNGGESWQVGNDKLITWTSFDSIGNVKLEYSKDNFSSDINVIDAFEEDIGYYLWTVPDDRSTTVRVRISFLGNGSVNDTSDADFSIVNPEITLSTPNGGETWYSGTQEQITWSSNDSVGNVLLEYSKDNFVSDVNSIVASTPDDGSYTWTVPQDPSTTVKVRICFLDNATVNDISAGTFTILLPTLDLTDPDGGEGWYRYTDNSITWSSTNSPGNVKLEYSKDDFDEDVNTIVASTADDGSYLWTVPNDESDTVKVRVSFVDAPTISDTSAAYFSIKVPSLSMTSPNGGELWEWDTAYSITWSSSDSLGNVKLEWSTDGFLADVNTIIASTTDDGSYSWTVPQMLSFTATVRVSYVANSSIYDVSNDNFELTPELRAYWDLDETSGTTAHDSVGDNDGTLRNGANFDSAGKLNWAVELDGNNDVIQVLDDDSLDVGLTDSITFAFWFWSDNQEFLIEKYYYPGGFRFYFSGDDIAFRVRDSNTRITSYTTSGNLDNGEWHHIVGVVNRSTARSYIYLNGVLEDDDDISSVDSMATSDSLYFGARTSGGRDATDGYMDEIRYYDVALNGNEVSALYNSYS